MKRHLYIFIAAIFLVVIAVSPVCAQKELPVTDEDVQWMLNGVNLNKGEIAPGSSNNEFQTIMSEFISQLNALNESFAVKSSLVGEFEFSSFQQLEDIEVVKIFKKNLQQYKEIQKHHYDQLDILLKSNRKKTAHT